MPVVVPAQRSRARAAPAAATARCLHTWWGAGWAPRAQGAQPWLSVCCWGGDSEPAFSFNKSLRSIRAPSLQSLLFRGNWQDWTAQLLQRYTSPAEKNPTVQGPQPCPLKYAVSIKAVKLDFKKPWLWTVSLDLGLMNKIQKQNKSGFHNGWREREPVQLQNLDPGTEVVFVCETCGNGWQ